MDGGAVCRTNRNAKLAFDNQRLSRVADLCWDLKISVQRKQLAEIARSRKPGLKVLFITGYAAKAGIRDEFLEPGMDMMMKPFALEALTEKIREMIHSGASAEGSKPTS